MVFPLSTPEVFTATGTDESVVVLLPSCPAEFDPQQYAFESEGTTQACAPPVEILVTVFPLNTPDVLTVTGRDELVVELLPSCPAEFDPQQYVVPVDATPHVEEVP